jgi:hypothetical protein
MRIPQLCSELSINTAKTKEKEKEKESKRKREQKEKGDKPVTKLAALQK